jgi:hypothetical protein
MAQVWLSFDEIQQAFGCDAADARRRVIANQWERRRCSDGMVRAQVPPDVAQNFFMLSSHIEPEPRPAPANEFEAAMAALCRIFGAEANARPATAISLVEGCVSGGENAQVQTAA